MMVSKGITLLAYVATNNEDIRDWRLKTTDLATWNISKIFTHQYHSEQNKGVTTSGKGGYTAVVQNIYDVPPPPTEEYHNAI